MPERSREEIIQVMTATDEMVRREEDRPRPAGSAPTGLGGPTLTWFNVQADSTVPDWSADDGWQAVTACHRAARDGADVDTRDTTIYVFNQLYSRRPKIDDTATYRNVGCVRDSAGDWIAKEYAWGVHYKD